MKKLVCVLLIMASFVCMAAELPEYSYIRIGDTGDLLRRVFLTIGYELTEYVEDDPVFDEKAWEALVEYQETWNLEASGEFDAETLRCALEIGEESLTDEIVWVPMNGGSKYHSKETCSKMIEPRQMPVECAEAFEFTACKRCH